MAWTTPKVFSPGEVLYAKDLNIYLRDNSLLTEAAIATGDGHYLTTDDNSDLVERSFGYSAVSEEQIIRWGNTGEWVENQEVPEITLRTGRSAIVGLYANISIDGHQEADSSYSTVEVYLGVEVVGTYNLSGTPAVVTRPTPIMQGFLRGGPDGTPVQWGLVNLVSGLTPGINTFRCKYITSRPGGGLINNQKLFVMPL